MPNENTPDTIGKQKITQNIPLLVKDLTNYQAAGKLIDLFKAKHVDVPNSMAYVRLDTQKDSKMLIALFQHNVEVTSDAAQELVKQAQMAQNEVKNAPLTVQVADQKDQQHYIMGLYLSKTDNGPEYLTAIPLFKTNGFIRIVPKPKDK